VTDFGERPFMDEKGIADKGSRRPLKLTTSKKSPTEVEGGNLDSLAEWIRLPAPGERCPRTGLSRSSYNDLIFADPPLIQSVVVKKPGASRGIRLIRWASVRAHLDSLVEQQIPESERGAS